MLNIIEKDDSPYTSKNRAFLSKMVENSVVLPFYEPSKDDFSEFKAHAEWKILDKMDRRAILTEIMSIKILKHERLSITLDVTNSRRI
jgi:hypothetical protein